MEYVDGGDLHRHLQQQPHFKLPEHHARFYAGEITLAIHHLHSEGIIHRDIKPENILLCSDGHIKLADYGLCTESFIGRRHTLGMGTTCYCAPESTRDPYYTSGLANLTLNPGKYHTIILPSNSAINQLSQQLIQELEFNALVPLIANLSEILAEYEEILAEYEEISIFRQFLDRSNLTFKADIYYTIWVPSNRALENIVNNFHIYNTLLNANVSIENFVKMHIFPGYFF
ncbi:unnamed protein product [Gordionus sp. m RMFG-2023]